MYERLVELISQYFSLDKYQRLIDTISLDNNPKKLVDRWALVCEGASSDELRTGNSSFIKSYGVYLTKIYKDPNEDSNKIQTTLILLFDYLTKQEYPAITFRNKTIHYRIDDVFDISEPDFYEDSKLVNCQLSFNTKGYVRR